MLNPPSQILCVASVIISGGSCGVKQTLSERHQGLANVSIPTVGAATILFAFIYSLSSHRLLSFAPHKIKMQTHDYSHVDHNEAQYADSSTEVESLVGGEKQWTCGDFHHTSQRSNRKILCSPLLAALRWVLVIGLQLIIVGLLARDQGLLDSTRWRGRSTSANQVGGDITGWGPHSKTYFQSH